MRVKCPWCASIEDKVVDSRLADEGDAIRRRRECQECSRRFTTFERVEEAPVWVIKRSGQREPFDTLKVIEGVRSAAKNRPVSQDQMEALAGEVTELVRPYGPELTSQQVGLAVLERIRALDDVAYLRFASVYKGFTDAGDFAREVGLLDKSTEPKRRG